MDRLSSITNLDAAQISKIKAYGEYWSKKLNDESPAEVKQARNMLVRSLRMVGGKSASLAFRSAMSKAILSDLQKTIKDSNTYKGINAIQVVSSLGTPRAVETLEDHLEPDLESRPEIRLWSAIGINGHSSSRMASDPMPSRKPPRTRTRRRSRDRSARPET